jgi:two-component sensor histidine kinase
MLSVLAVLLFGDTKSSWIWLFTFLGIVLLIALMHKSQTTFTIKYDQSYNVFFYTACLTGVPLCTFLIAFIFEKETKYSFRLLQENQALLISNEEKDLLIREIHHRVKNNLQIISSLVNLQIHELQDEKTINILNVTRSRIFALSLIHQKLFTGNNTGTVNFKEHILDLIESQQKVYFQIDSSVQGPDIDLELDLATPLSLIVSEIITNAFKHAFTRVKKPQIDVIIKKLAVGNYRLTVKDNGRGIPENFDYEGSTSLGMEIIRSLVAQIEGKINFISGSPGTEACIDFSLKKTV